jgi:hypothetical protein
MTDVPTKKSAAERLAEILRTPIPRAKPKAVVPKENPAEANRRLLERLQLEWSVRTGDAVRRQQAIDSTWRRSLEARREAEEAAAWGCHKGPNDSDFGLK